MSNAMGTLASLMLELEKRSEALSADEPSKQIKPTAEAAVSGEDAKTKTENKTDSTTKELKPKEADQAPGIKVTVQEQGNKPLSTEKAAGESDNVRKELKPLEATDASAEKVKTDEVGNQPVADTTPGTQPATEKGQEVKPDSATNKSAAAPMVPLAPGIGAVSRGPSKIMPEMSRALSAIHREIPSKTTQAAPNVADVSSHDDPVANDVGQEMLSRNTAKVMPSIDATMPTLNRAMQAVKGPGTPVYLKKSNALLIKVIKKASLMQKIAKLLAADDRPTNKPKEITAEGSEAAKLDNTIPNQAKTDASEAVGKATDDYTMHRSQSKAKDTSLIGIQRESLSGSAKAQDGQKIANAIGNLIRTKSAKSVSKKQQKFMGMVHAVQKGDMKAPSGEVAEVAKEMKPGAVKDYAETKQKGLPEKKEAAMKKLAAVLRKSSEVIINGKPLQAPADTERSLPLAGPSTASRLAKLMARVSPISEKLDATNPVRTAGRMSVKQTPKADVDSAVLKGQTANKLRKAQEAGVAEGKPTPKVQSKLEQVSAAAKSLAGRMGEMAGKHPYATGAGALAHGLIVGGVLGLGTYATIKALKNKKRNSESEAATLGAQVAGA